MRLLMEQNFVMEHMTVIDILGDSYFNMLPAGTYSQPRSNRKSFSQVTHSVASAFLVCSLSLSMALLEQGATQSHFCHTESGMASTKIQRSFISKTY